MLDETSTGTSTITVRCGGVDRRGAKLLTALASAASIAAAGPSRSPSGPTSGSPGGPGFDDVDRADDVGRAHVANVHVREEIDDQPALRLKTGDRIAWLTRRRPMPTLTENVSACDGVFAQPAQRRLQLGLAGSAQLVGDHAAAAGQLEQAVAGEALDARRSPAPPHSIATGSATMVDTAGARASAAGRMSTVAPHAGSDASASKAHRHFIPVIIDAPRRRSPL